MAPGAGSCTVHPSIKRIFNHMPNQPQTPNQDLTHMRRAIELSRTALDAGDKPYGAVAVAPDGSVLHAAANTQTTRADATAHAEMVLVREAQARLGAAALRGSTVYASGEPCAMCSGALFWAGVGRVVFAAPNDAMGQLLGGDLLPIGCRQVLANATPPVQVDGPVLADEALAVLREARDRSAR